MKVYILFWCSDILGVYLDKEKAEIACNQKIKEKWNSPYVYLEEYETQDDPTLKEY